MSESSATEPSAPRPRGRALTLGLIAGLVLAALAVYANAIDHPFLYDDVPLVLKNTRIRSLDNLPEMIGFTADGGFEPRTRWTREVTHALEFAAVGESPLLFHATNVVLHALVGLIAFALATMLTQSRTVGAWAAALFVVHPIQTEVVAHVSGRRDLLAALFSLLTIWLLCSWSRRGGLWRIPAALVCLYLGSFSKEVALLTPLAFVLVEVYQRWREGGGPRDLVRLVGERRALYAVLALSVVLLAGTFLFWAPSAPGLGGSRGFYETQGDGVGPLERLRVLGLGFRLLVLPVGQTVDYSFDALGFAESTWSPMAVVDLLCFPLALALTAWGIARRNWFGFAGLWHLIFFLPHLGLISWHEIFAERFLYLPSLGWFLAFAATGVAVARQPRLRTALAGAGAVVLVLLAVATHARNRAWASPLALWQSAVESHPRCARAHKALGDAYLELTRADAAAEHYQTAVAILPTYLDAHVGLTMAYAARMDMGLAMRTLEATIERWPDDPKIWNVRGWLLETLGDLPEAKKSYETVIEKDPRFANAYNNLARLHVLAGDAEGAIDMYEKAIEIDPSLVVAYRNLATVYREALQDEERAAYYDTQAERLLEIR